MDRTDYKLHDIQFPKKANCSSKSKVIRYTLNVKTLTEKINTLNFNNFLNKEGFSVKQLPLTLPKDMGRIL